MKTKLTAFLILFCALSTGAQNLSETYVALADSADNYIRQMQWPDAERVIVEALRIEPANKSNYLLWSNLGIVRTHQENYEGALEAFDIGLVTAPRSTVLLQNRVQTLLKLDRKQEAIKDLTTVLDVDSTLQWPLKMRGLLRMVEGDTQGAENDFSTYRRMHGSDASVAEAEGDMANALGRGDEALERYQEAFKLEPESYLMTKLLVTAHFYDRLEEFEPLLTEELKKHPREGSLYLMRAMLNKKRFQTEAVEKDLKIAKDFGVDEMLYRQLTESNK